MELTAWVAFTEATKENGCMKLLPGSHRQWRYDEKARMKWDDARSDSTFFGYNYDDIKIDKTWNPDEEQVAHVTPPDRKVEQPCFLGWDRGLFFRSVV